MLHFAAVYWQSPLRILHPKPARLQSRRYEPIRNCAPQPHHISGHVGVFCLAYCLYCAAFCCCVLAVATSHLASKVSLFASHRCECVLPDSAPFATCCGFECYRHRAETLGRCSECSCIVARATWSARASLVTALEGCLRSASSFSARHLRLPSSAALLAAVLPPQLIERACHDRNPY